jgi:excisionase family DNA binding protein
MRSSDTAGYLLTPRQVAEMFHFTTPRPVYRWIREGRLPASRVGARLVIKRTHVDELIERGRVEAKRRRGGLRELERQR